MSGIHPPVKAGLKPHSIPLYFFMNGTVHFGQNILAFSILQSTSPVTYSIASLIKRVAVIIIAIIWFSQPVNAVQAMGICLTFRWSLDVQLGQGERRKRGEEDAARRGYPEHDVAHYFGREYQHDFLDLHRAIHSLPRSIVPSHRHSTEENNCYQTAFRCYPGSNGQADYSAVVMLSTRCAFYRRQDSPYCYM